MELVMMVETGEESQQVDWLVPQGATSFEATLNFAQMNYSIMKDRVY